MEIVQIQLTQTQLEEIEPVIDALTAKYKLVEIICFGATINSYELTGCFSGQVQKSVNHYFLLIVTKSSTRIEHQLQDYVRWLPSGKNIILIAHGQKTVQGALKGKSRFFITVYRYGQVLYRDDSSHLQTAIGDLPQFNAADTSVVARLRFEHHHELAIGFLEAADTLANEERMLNRLFFLHQAVEQICITLMRVCTAYRADIHNLDRLLKLCCCIDPEIANYFSRRTDEENRLFDVLNKSYSLARYGKPFEFNDSDVLILTELVHDFLLYAQKRCEQTIAAFKGAAEKEPELEVNNR